MVTRKLVSLTCLVLGVFCAAAVLACVPSAQAQVTYSVSQEWLKVWVNPDGSTVFLYNITFTYLSGSPQGLFDLGMPKPGYQIHDIQDLSNSSLQYRDISNGSYLGIEVAMKQPISLNQPYTFIVYASVNGLVTPDSTNPSNVGMQFYPGTFQGVTGTEDLRVEFVLPSGVPQDSVRSPQGLDFENVFVDENRTAVYWERPQWQPSEPFLAGVSFPAQYVTVTPYPSGYTIGPISTSIEGGFPIEFAAAAAVAFFIIIVIVILLVVGLAKSVYESPRLSVEALGANRSLTAVEAGLVMGLKPVRVITMMLYGLLLKRQVAVVESEPLLKLKRLETPPNEPPQQTTPETTATPAAAPLRYYEIDFLGAIKPDGTLDEAALADAYRGLVNTVNQKLKGYSREDTENYYRSIVETAWGQVTRAGTADLMGDALDKNLEWLLADNKFDDNLRTAFPPGIVIVPNPMWWWYWGGPRIPTATQSTAQPSQPSTPPSQPATFTGPPVPPGPRFSPTTPAPVRPVPVAGQDFANNIVKGVQGASNNIVVNVQDFANKLVPFAAPQSRGDGSVAGGSHPSCVCACHACACHCACVSCACACAGGGAH
jgi:hypothetical protein